MSLEKIHNHLNAHVHHRLSFLAVAAALALVLNLVNAQVRALAQDQAPTGDVTAPVVQPDTSQPVLPSEPPPSNGDQPREEQQQDIVDPQELRNTLQDIKRQRGELRGILRQITRLKLANASDLLKKAKDLDNLLAGMENNIKTTLSREALQEYYDERTWEQVEEIRTLVQLPRELKDIARSISKIEKMLKSKPFQKIGLDIAKLSALLDQIKTAHKAANDAFNAGNMEEAREAMQTFWEEGMHPGGFEGALHRMRKIKNLLRAIKDKEIIAAVEELLAPVYGALYGGDFNEVHNVLNEYEDDLRRLANKIIRSRLRYDKVRGGLDQLEDLIRSRFESLEQQAQERENQKQAPQEAPQPAPTQ